MHEGMRDFNARRAEYRAPAKSENRDQGELLDDTRHRFIPPRKRHHFVKKASERELF
jgi:hypothetical protein